MKQASVKLGPLALLLTVISICLTVLAILTFTTSRADLRLAEKYARTVSERAALEAEGQEFLRGVRLGTADAVPDGDGIYWYTAERDGASLTVGVTAEGEIVSWRHEKAWAQDPEIENLWPGF